MKIVSKASLMERVTIGRRGCWVCNGALSKEGYGVLRCGDGQRPAPRLFWESFVGIFTPNHRILFRKVPGCVGKACCNPAHHRLQGPVVSSELEFCMLGHPLTGDNVVVENRNGREFKRCRNPLFSIKNAAREMKVSFPTASSAAARITKAGILRESSGKRRDRLFLYESYLDILNQES
jgi:hypothetical protein